MEIFYRIVSELNFNVLNILGYCALGLVFYVGANVLYKSAKKIINQL